MLHITKYTLNTTHCTQHTIHYTLQIKQKPMHTLSYTLIHFKMYHALYRLWSRRWNVSAKQILAGTLFRQFLQVQQIQGPDNIYWGEPLNNTSGTFLINGLIWGKGSHTYLQIFIETNQHKPNKQTKILPTSVPHSPPHSSQVTWQTGQVTCVRHWQAQVWQVTLDMWHVTCDTWHVTVPLPKFARVTNSIYLFVYMFFYIILFYLQTFWLLHTFGGERGCHVSYVTYHTCKCH